MTIRKIANNATLACWADKHVLYSYETPVAAWVLGKGYMRTNKFFSRTTSKHIGTWLGDCNVEVVEQYIIDALCA